MKKLRILTLMHKDLIPPEDVKSRHEDFMPEWRTEFDVIHGLEKSGHEVHKLGVVHDLGKIRQAIEELRPHIVFNLLEEFHNEPLYDQHVVSYLELMRQPYTGCNPRGLTLSRDKALSKKILMYHRIPTPAFAVFPIGKKIHKPKRLQYPLVVKSLNADASFGISQASVVTNDAKLKERIEFIHASIGTDALVEEFIEGRELYLGMMGNNRLEHFPIWELSFKNLEDKHNIATSKVKWDSKYQDKIGAHRGPAKNLPPEVEKRIIQVAKKVYRRIGFTGYGRIDFRLTPEGKPYVLEANPNPDIAKDDEFAKSAQPAGYSYHELLQKIMTMGLSYAKKRFVKIEV